MTLADPPPPPSMEFSIIDFIFFEPFPKEAIEVLLASLMKTSGCGSSVFMDWNVLSIICQLLAFFANYVINNTFCKTIYWLI